MRKHTAETIQQTLIKNESKLRLVEETFISYHSNATFIDPDYGTFQSTPNSVLTGNCKGHPDGTKARRMETNLQLHGITNPIHSEISKINSKITIQSEEYKENRRSINQQLYGGNSTFSSEAVRNKTKETIKLRYGVDHISKVDSVKKKVMKTCQEKYGSNSYLGSDVCLQQTKEVMVERYGFEHPMQVEQFVNKSLESRSKNNHINGFKSKGEVEVRTFLEGLGLKTSHFASGKIEIDILIPELNVGIEYNGCYWHREDIRGARYHIDKTDYYRKLGIRIIQIWDFEWLKRPEQVKDFLTSAVGKSHTKIGMRKCNLVELTEQQGKKLLDAWHIQGSTKNVQLTLGIQYKGEIIGVATFGKHHRGLDTRPVLSRFCCSPGVTINGALSKVSQYASNKFESDLISWADLRLSTGAGYLKAGWQIEDTLPPDYFYWDDRKRCPISKQSRRKTAAGTPEGMTEEQHATLDGLVRVWDCGKLRLVFKRRLV